MSPRTRNRRAPLRFSSSTPSNHSRSSRRPSGTQNSSSPEQRPVPTGSSKIPSAGPTTRSRKHVRTSSTSQKASSGNGGSEGSADGAKTMDENDQGNSEEPEVHAPSGPITRKRGHQTGLSVTFSNTNIGGVHAGSKRELSVSTVDSEIKTRPRKISKVEPPPSVDAPDFGLRGPPQEDPTAWDSDYGEVDAISESEEDMGDSDIEREEEQRIIQSIEHEAATMAKRGHSVDSWADFSLEVAPVDDESQFFSEHFALTEPNSEQDATGPEGFPRTSTSDPPPVRRVRFADLESSSSGSSATNSEAEDFAFPDLLLEQERMPSKAAISIIEHEEDANDFSDGSYWDFEGPMPVLLSRAKTPLPSDRQRSSSSSSGYETDTSEGETTDEDPIPPQTVNRPQANLRLVNDSSGPKRVFSRASLPPASSRTKNGKGPSLGTWIADPAKPIGIVDHKTKKMLFLRPPILSSSRGGVAFALEEPSRHATAQARIRQPNHTDEDGSDATATNDLPMQSPGADVMMSGFLSDILEGSAHGSDGITGPPEAFFPLEDFGMEPQDDDEDPEDQLDISDFIDFGDGSSDSNGEGENEPESEDLLVSPLSSQKLPTIRPKQSKDRTSSQSLLNHFDKGIVSAFRRNQHRHQSVLRRPLTPSRSLAIKGGRHLAASSPISPMRKRRADSQSMAPFTGLNGTGMRKGTF